MLCAPLLIPDVAFSVVSEVNLQALCHGSAHREVSKYPAIVTTAEAVIWQKLKKNNYARYRWK